MREEAFWLGIWGIVGIIICTLIICITTITLQTDRRIAESIKLGADPMSVKYAFRPSGDTGERILVTLRNANGSKLAELTQK